MPQGPGVTGPASVATVDAVLGVMGGTDMGVAGVAGVHGQLGLLHPDAPEPTEQVGLVAVLRTLPSLEVDSEKDVRMGFSRWRKLAAKPVRGPTAGRGEVGGDGGKGSEEDW